MSDSKGLYGKFFVLPMPVDEELLDNYRALSDVFVLRPDKDMAARHALATYAQWTTDESLKESLIEWINSLSLIDPNTPRPERGRR